jgi:hypothetical protein
MRGNYKLTRQTLFASAAGAAIVLALTPALLASAGAEPNGPAGITDPIMLGAVTTVGSDQFATTDLATLLDPSGTSTQHYGPYASKSEDSGTCGNNWADDAFDRHFTVRTNSPGVFTVVEQFRDGEFKTPSTVSPNTNQSPGACQTALAPAGNGGTVDPGITGSLHGYFIIPNVLVQTSHDVHCDALLLTNDNCTTATFINTHFAPCYTATCPVTTFFFRYVARDQCLIQHEWQNASSDVGGNKGDIVSGHPCCEEGDGEGDFQGHQKGNFSFDGDGCRDGDSNSVDSTNVGDGRDFHSTSIQSMQYDSLANTVTITGAGLAGGVPTSFVFVALETGPTTPGWVSFTLGDGYNVAGNLLNGSVVLH